MTGTQSRQGHAAGAPGSSRMPGGARRRAFFFLLPNLADDSELDVYAFRLLAHYQRVAGAGGACAEPTATTAARCRMSPRRVVQARTEPVGLPPLGETPAPAAAAPRITSRPPLHLVQAPRVPTGRTPDKTPEDTGL